MFTLENADKFIKDFEAIYQKKVYRVPFSLKIDNTAALLMCKCGKRWISLPYLSQGVIETLPKRFDLPTIPKYWEIRDTKPCSKYAYSNKINLELNLKDTDYNYTSNIRRKIHKAQNNDIIITHGSNEKYLNDFYEVYSRRMHEIGVPPQSKECIQKAVSLETTEIFVAYLASKPIGGATLCKITEEYYENALFATLESNQHLYPSYLLHHEMIDYCKQCNALTYSFGRSTAGSSVYEFKSHFHCQEIPLFWSSSHKRKDIRSNRWFFSLYKLLPYHLSIVLGKYIQKYIY